MVDSRRQQRGQGLPARRQPIFHVVRNTLSSTQPPNFTTNISVAEPRSSSGTFRVPSPTSSEEEEIIRHESQQSSTPELPARDTSGFPVNIDFTNNCKDRLSFLGDSSSLFNSEDLPGHDNVKPHFQFSEPECFDKKIFEFESPSSLKMVVEREPPKATPQKLPRSEFPNVHQPEFGKPSPLQNRLKPDAMFNIPKPHQPRPEHHRPDSDAEKSRLKTAKDLSQNIVDGFRAIPKTRPQDDPEIIEIPRPMNAPPQNIYPRPAPVFTAYSAPTNGFSAVNAYQAPYVDLTKTVSQDHFNPDAALFDDRFGVADPHTYVDAGKATENIKALLEGAFDDEDDKPRTRGRKKKAEAAVEDLADKLHSLDVKKEEDRDPINSKQEDEESEEDDGTVEGLAVKLLPHQVDGVYWMRDKEISVKKKNGILPKGGILADDMGLGKTIQSIALMLTNPRPPISSDSSVKDKNALSATIGKNTLVVAPLALIKQWEAEIKNRVSDSHKLRVCVHHGPQRTKRFEDLKKYDVVITTYQILVSEHGHSSQQEDGPRTGCFGIHWYRVILDEAHTIKNRNAKATQACYNLRAEYRWCLTGTPMQNNLDELQSLIKFLRIKPYNDLSIWRDQITRPMSQGRGGVAMKRLQFYLKAFMKRRTKDVLKQQGALNPGGKSNADEQNNGFKITARKVKSVLTEFSPDERKFYDRLEQRTDRSLEQMMGRQELNYASALVLLLRLRQACNHPRLIGGNMAQDRDALSTGQATTGAQTPRKSKTADNDIDAMADLLGGLSMQTKQCDVCQIELNTDEVSAGSIRCPECEEDLQSQMLKGKTTTKHKKGPSLVKTKSKKAKPRAPNIRKLVLADHEQEEDGDWVVPDNQRGSLNLGKAGGSDDENAEGGGESLASDDTDTEDESEIRALGSRQRQVISVDSSSEDNEDEKEQLSLEELSDDEEENEDSSSDSEQSLPITSSAKIRHLLEILRRESSKYKFIVFSQFTSMLDLIEPFLKRENLIFTRYDGGMRNEMREANLDRLRNHSKTRILLCSLKCGSLGLNLTAASRVVILEPFWNPFVEEQAIDRVHRLNQTLDVKVYKLTVADTVEARILELQEKKRALANAAIEGKGVGKLSMQDILNLFKHDAEHDRQHDADPTLGTKTKVLAPGDHMASNENRGSSSMRVTPPVMEKPRTAHEDSVFGRRW